MAKTSTDQKDEKYLAFKRLVEGVADHYHQNERRQVPRFPFNVRVSICEKLPGGAWVHFTDAWAQDLSFEGIGLLTTVKLPNHRSLAVNFEPVLGQRRLIRFSLSYCDRAIPGLYRTGGSFLFDDL